MCRWSQAHRGARMAGIGFKGGIDLYEIVYGVSFSIIAHGATLSEQRKLLGNGGVDIDLQREPGWC